MKTLLRIQLVLFSLMFIARLTNAQNITAHFTSPSFSVCKGDSICFTDSSTSPTYPITTWKWNFNDGNYSNLQNPCHAFNLASTYSVCLTIKNSNNDSDIVCHTVTVNPLPFITITAIPDSILPGATDTLIASGGISYIWNDCSCRDTLYVSPIIDTYYCVTGTDINGCSDTACSFIYIMSIAGIQHYDNFKSISPNPFSLTATLQSNHIFKNAILKLYNAKGQQVKLIRNISGQTITLFRDQLPSGLYYTQLTENNMIYITDKIIISDTP